MPPQRATDIEVIRQVATNTADIGYLQEGHEELSDKVDAIIVRLDTIISRIDSKDNQFLGASKLVRATVIAFPVLCGIVGWLSGYKMGDFHI